MKRLRGFRGPWKAIVLANAVLWLIVTSVLVWAPREYTSSWKLILPGSETDPRISLQNVGQASAGSRSYYESRALDHRVNYRVIARSAPVLAAAGEPLELTWKEMDNLRIRLVDQSSIMEFEIRAESAAEARERAWAHYGAFQERLSALREDELARRKEGIDRAIREAQEKMELELTAVRDYKLTSGLVSEVQVDQLIETAFQLRSLQFQTEAKLALAQARLDAAASGLRLDRAQVPDLLPLLSDRAYLAGLTRYNAAVAESTANSSRWGARHPERVANERRVATMQEALRSRASQLLGRVVGPQEIDRLNFIADPREATSTLETLSAALSDSQALEAEVGDLRSRAGSLEAQLAEYGAKQSMLENLEQRVKLAQAIFNSTIGKADIGRMNLFSSYPLVQLLTEPGLPDQPSAPRPALILAAAVIASLCLSGGLLLLHVGAPYVLRRIKSWLGVEAAAWEEAA